VIEVRDFPAVVTMDAHGESLHADIQDLSTKRLEALLQA
jgi:fumarate hydratase class I